MSKNIIAPADGDDLEPQIKEMMNGGLSRDDALMEIGFQIGRNTERFLADAKLRSAEHSAAFHRASRRRDKVRAGAKGNQKKRRLAAAQAKAIRTPQ
jgi:hypothetical protein